MGRKRHGQRRNQAAKQENGEGKDAAGYDLIPRGQPNEMFIEYYKKQGIIPENEFEDFCAVMKKELPIAFRIVGCRSNSQKVLQKLINDRFVNEWTDVEIDGEMIAAPTQLPWYPNGHAYTAKVSRSACRKNEKLKSFHNFLVTETELGNVSRQEAVSMIPPLLLDVKPHHAVLDLCAAPGSKTAQLVEMLHSAADDDGQTVQSLPDGLVVANDADNARCYLLVHQTLKRLMSPCCLVMNHDAAHLPKIRLSSSIDSKPKYLNFDRVLCDVVCSGDGTMRKNPDVATKWSAASGIGLHKLQYRIAKRGLELLKTDGLFVYSTCSLNPIEDEAIVAELLRFGQGSIELVDVSEKLPGLLRTPGTSVWQVMDKKGCLYASHDAVAESLQKAITKSMFPPTEIEAKQFHLERSFRILPHHQDTGGFYVALLKKVAPFSWEKTNTENEHSPSPSSSADETGNYAPPPPKKKKGAKKTYKEDPFVFLDDNSAKWSQVKDYFGVADTFPSHLLFARSSDNEKEGMMQRNLFIVNDRIKLILECNKGLMVINAGLRIFGRVEKKFEPCPFRLSQEGLPILFDHLTKRIEQVTSEDLVVMLEAGRNCPLTTLSADVATALQTHSTGSMAVYCTLPHGHRVSMCVWKGQLTVSPYVDRETRLHLLRLLGRDCTALERFLLDKRKNPKQSKIVGDSNSIQSEETEEIVAKNGDNDDLTVDSDIVPIGTQ